MIFGARKVIFRAQLLSTENIKSHRWVDIHYGYAEKKYFTIIKYINEILNYLNKTVKWDSEQTTQIGYLGYLRFLPTTIDL